MFKRATCFDLWTVIHKVTTVPPKKVHWGCSNVFEEHYVSRSIVFTCLFSAIKFYFLFTIRELFISVPSDSVKLQWRQCSDDAACVLSYVVANCQVLLLPLHAFKQHGFSVIQLSCTAVKRQYHCLHAPVLNIYVACSHGFDLCFPWFQDVYSGYYHFLPNTFQLTSHSAISVV